MKKIIVILITMLLISTVIQVAGTINEKEKMYLLGSHDQLNHINNEYASSNIEGTVLWDNGLHYYGYISSQWDPQGDFECILADDFIFDDTTVITGINWNAGYLNPVSDGDFDFNITFYSDVGDGSMPGDILYKQVFSNDEVHETFLEFYEVPDNPIVNANIYNYWVDLVDPITFNGGEKYWISIQGIGVFPPQLAWCVHPPVVNHNFVIKSEYFGYSDWSNFLGDTPIYTDACFQLTGEGDEPIPDLEGGGNIVWEDVAINSMINGTVTISNVGDTGSIVEWQVQSVPQDWGINWSVRWYRLDEIADFEGGFVGTTDIETLIVQVLSPDEKNQEFSGEIVIANTDNPEDTITISIVCNTPRSKIYQMPLFRFFENCPSIYLIINKILKL
jgi:hypothetical protein